MTPHQATKQLHETVQAKAKELGLEVKITGDYCFKLVKHRNFNKQILESVFLSHDVEGDKCISGQETMLNAISVQSITLIEEPQLKQIFVAFEEKLGRLNIEIKESGGGFYALLNNDFLFCIKKNVGFTGYKREFFKSKNKNETYKNFLQNDTFGLEKRIFSTKKELETELNKYYLDEEDSESAEALYQKYCYDYPTSGFKKDPVKALLEVDKIIKSL